jgi:HK97 family phage major capsid protein
MTPTAPTAPRPKLTREQEWQRPQYRELLIEKAAEGAEGQDPNRIALCFSSEDPYERRWGFEILDHAPAMVDLSRLQNAAPFLLGHSWDERYEEMVLGVLEKVRVDVDHRGRCDVRFSQNDRPQRILKDIKDGIRPKISVAYTYTADPREMKPEEMSEDLKAKCLAAGKKAYRCAWAPYEVSSVAVAADDTVGVGRAQEQEPTPSPSPQEVRMDPKNTPPSAEELARQQAERKATIEAIGKKYAGRIRGGEKAMDTLVKDAIELEQPIELFRGMVFQRVNDDEPLETPDSFIDMPQAELKRYSISRAILAMIHPNQESLEFQGRKIDLGLEREASAAVAKNRGVTPRGIYVPYDVQARRPEVPAEVTRELASILARHHINPTRVLRDLTVGSATAGGNLVGTNLLGGSFIDLLRNKALAFKLGVPFMGGLRENVAIPKQTGASTAYWVSETGDVTESAMTFGQVTLSPKHIGALIEFTRQLLIQSNPAIDLLVTRDIVRVLGLGIDKAFFHGSGLSNQPTGLAGTDGIGTVDGASFGWPQAVEFETDVEEANADEGTLAYVTRPSVKGALKTRAKEAGYPVYLVEKGELNGYPLYVSNQIEAAHIFFGDFAQGIIGGFGSLDLYEDRATKSASGGYRIVGLQSVDIGIRQPGAFSVCENFS